MSTHVKTAGRILLGITGGIAAYKACSLVSLMVKQGFEARVVMTDSARQLVGPATLAALTGHEVACDQFAAKEGLLIPHIDLARWADLVVVAPATANIMAKAVQGLADDLLSSILLATSAPILYAPAMNPQMWQHPAVQDNVSRLQARGAHMAGPAAGRTACGEEGAGRMAEPAAILDHCLSLLTPKDLRGVPFLITAGPTREYIDPVRFISNPSSGRMGLELAKAAQQRGAEVLLVMGPTHLLPAEGLKVIRVVSAADMAEAVFKEAGQAKVIIKAAAVGDYAAKTIADQKMKKSASLVLELAPTADILNQLGRDKGGRILVGFAAETQELLNNARKKLMAKNLDLLVANDVSQPQAGFQVETNQVQILDRQGGVEPLPLLTKEAVAHRILDRVAHLLAEDGYDLTS